MRAPDIESHPANQKAESPERNTVITECDLPDAPEKVWKALTVPKWLKAWLPEAIESEILAAEPNRLLRYRWAGGEADKDASGRALESVVTFELTGRADGGTHLRVVHRVAEESRVIPFGPRKKAPVAMAVGSSCARRHRGTLVVTAVLRRAA
jgi:uncharacterized protein YndB with AHSA1/START domain